MRYMVLSNIILVNQEHLRAFKLLWHNSLKSTFEVDRFWFTAKCDRKFGHHLLELFINENCKLRAWYL